MKHISRVCFVLVCLNCTSFQRNIHGVKVVKTKDSRVFYTSCLRFTPENMFHFIKGHSENEKCQWSEAKRLTYNKMTSIWLSYFCHFLKSFQPRANGWEKGQNVATLLLRGFWLASTEQLFAGLLTLQKMWIIWNLCRKYLF